MLTKDDTYKQTLTMFEQPQAKKKAKVVSFINLKGGVAKTTTAVGTAECLAAQGYKVLVVDLDPQTNATVMLISEEEWENLNDNGYTLATLFRDAAGDTQEFDINKTVCAATTCVREAKGRLFILPSSLDLIVEQDKLIKQMTGGDCNPVEVLKEALEPIINNYDYILIDCPPTLNLITKNGLRISDGYLIPTIPDILSTKGIPQILSMIEKFSSSKRRKLSLSCLGIVPTKIRMNTQLHVNTLQTLEHKANSLAPLFTARFYERIQAAGAPGIGIGATMNMKWGNLAREFDIFVHELKQRLN